MNLIKKFTNRNNHNSSERLSVKSVMNKFNELMEEPKQNNNKELMLLFKEITTLRALLVNKGVFTNEEWTLALNECDNFINTLK